MKYQNHLTIRNCPKRIKLQKQLTKQKKKRSFPPDQPRTSAIHIKTQNKRHPPMSYCLDNCHGESLWNIKTRNYITKKIPIREHLKQNNRRFHKIMKKRIKEN